MMEVFDFPPEFAGEANNLAIDFDGVIHDSNKGFYDGTCYGDPIPGALEALQILSSKFRIVIFTAKAKPNRPLVNGKSGTELVSEWLESHGMLQYVAEITSEKPRAMLYIDDNAYRFENWKDALAFTSKL